ncbi:MAG: HlyD family efflux transporter periplasmic adaptor subunit, partial [Solirubrobacterales bacterium]|nr:HlyD family efflux transporter periplasmic adaptor subunit [Solirubrobacterales bacterium]
MRARRNTHWHLYLLALLTAGVAVLAVTQIGAPAAAVRTAQETVTAQDGVVQSTVSGTGNVQAATDVGANFQTSGTLSQVFVHVGQHVTDGELLATLDPTAAQLAVDQAQESLTAAQDQLTAVENGTASTGSSGSGSGGSSSGSGGSGSGGSGSGGSGSGGSGGGTSTSTSYTPGPASAEFVALGWRPAPGTTSSTSTTATTAPARTTTQTTPARSTTATTPARGTTSAPTSASGSTRSTASSFTGSTRSSSTGSSASSSTGSTGSSSTGSSASGSTRSNTTTTPTTTTTTPSPGSIASAQAAVYSAQANLSNAESELTKTQLHAPASGTIVSLASLTPGDAVPAGASSSGSGGSSSSAASSSGGSGAAGAGTTAGTLGGGASSSSSGSGSSSPFAEIVDTSQMVMTVAFSESDISQVRVGQPATITVDALSGVELAGHVSSISTVGSSSSGVVSYDATLDLDQTDPRVKPGMSASASVITGQAQGVTLPNQAISGSGSLGTVDLLQAGKAVPTQVVVGLRGDNRTQIISGLSAGQQVVVTITLPSLASTATGTTGSSGTLGGAGVRLGGGGGFFGGGGGFRGGAAGGGAGGGGA